MTDDCMEVKNEIPSLIAFIPFAPLTVRVFYTSMPLKWIGLFMVLETISLLSFYLNSVANDFFWCLLSVCAYILITLPIYMNSFKNNVVNVEGRHRKLTFVNLSTTCANAVFSDYRISLLSKIPLALQVLAGGSLLYEVFGADWILHALAGFGVGAIALKAYVTGVGQFSYSRLASHFHLDRFRTFKVERRTASAEFTLFSIIVVALAWEAFERTVHFISPVNVFRVGWEPLWNIFGDISFALVGGMIAWYILNRSIYDRFNRPKPD